MMTENGSIGEVLTRFDIDLAYSLEKLLNLDIPLMHIADPVSHYEALAVDNENASCDSFDKALEFDILYGILDSEAKKLDNFMVSLQQRIFDVREKISSCNLSIETYTIEMEEKLCDCEESLKWFQGQVAEMRIQSTRLETTMAFGGQEHCNSKVVMFRENSQLSSINAKMKLQITEQQRHILQMLEKSLARELDLEKKLSDSKYIEEELKLKLDHLKREACCMEETKDLISEKFFEAENVTIVLMGISKELMGRLQIVQFNLNSLLQRESEARLKLQNHTQLETLRGEITNLKDKLKEAEDRCNITESEAATLLEKVNLLKGKLRESNIHLQLTRASFEVSQDQQNLLSSEINNLDLENVIDDLQESVSRAEAHAQSVESKCKLLAENNLEFNEELGLLRNNNEIDKVNLLEKQLRHSETQLQHANASIEASKEQHAMLCSTLHDMENLMKGLKVKASKVEVRAESAESKCVLLTETNLELNEELGFLRGRIECLETSLHQADDRKIATAKDIGTRVKGIADLVMQLAMERERLQTQISSLREEVKYWKEKTDASILVTNAGDKDAKGNFSPKNDSHANPSSKSLEETVTDALSKSFQVDKLARHVPLCPTEARPTIAAEDAVSVVSKLEIVPSIDAGLSSLKHFFMVFLIVLILIVSVYIFQQKSCPF